MYRVLAVLRTVYLLFVIGYTVRGEPIFATVPRTLDEQYSRCAGSLDVIRHGVWLAIAWIAFETLVGWLLVSRRKPAAPAAPAPPASSAAPRPGA